MDHSSSGVLEAAHPRIMPKTPHTSHGVCLLADKESVMPVQQVTAAAGQAMLHLAAFGSRAEVMVKAAV